MRHVLIRLLINAAALFVAVKLIPGIHFTGGVGKLLLVALVFGLVNAGVPLHGLEAGMWAVPVATLVGRPIGILAGVYLNEYARDNWFTRIVNLAVMNLAGVPSIVHALFAFGGK